MYMYMYIHIYIYIYIYIWIFIYIYIFIFGYLYIYIYLYLDNRWNFGFRGDQNPDNLPCVLARPLFPDWMVSFEKRLYPFVNQHSYWKLQFIVDLPI